MSEPSLLRAATAGDGLRLEAAGSWTAAHAGAAAEMVDAARRQALPASEVAIDVAGVRELDTFGAWLLERLARSGTDEGRQARFVGVPERFQGLLREVQRANRQAVAPAAQPSALRSGVESIGRSLIDVASDLRAFAELFGAICIALARVLVRPSTFRLTSAVHHLDRVAWQAVGIILLITLLIGGIIAQQGFFHFRKFGADDYVVDLVGLLVLREIGVLIVAIMVAGRSGSSYTAELGSMKMREEIDALRTMGLDPVEILILPRVLALILAVPILTFIGMMAALWGAGMIAWFYGGMAPEIFLARLRAAISTTHFEVGMIKAPFMALVIGVVACVQGLRVLGSAESLGLRTTESVVQSIFMVIVLDGLFAIFFASIGM